MLSRTSPNASVVSSSVFSSYYSTVNPYRSVVKNNLDFPFELSLGLHNAIVAILPYIGTSNIGFSPLGVKR